MIAILASLFLFQAYAATYTYIVSAQNTNGVVRFFFSGDASGVDPTLQVKTGDTLIFVVSGLTVAPAQTFFIATTNNTNGSTQYTGQSPSAGLTTADGNLTLTIGTLLSTPTNLYYLSKISAVASGLIQVTKGIDCTTTSNNGGDAFDGTAAGAGVGDCFQNNVLTNGNICYPTCSSGSPGNLTGVCGDGIIKVTGYCAGFPVNTPTPTTTTPTPAPSPGTVIIVVPTPSPSPNPTPSPSSSNNNDNNNYVFLFSGTSTNNCAYVSNTLVPRVQNYGNSAYAGNEADFSANSVSCTDNSSGGSTFVISTTISGNNANDAVGDRYTYENNIANELTDNNSGVTITNVSQTSAGFVMQASVALFAAVALATMA